MPTLHHLVRVDRVALAVVGEHVAEADDRGLLAAVLGVVTLDRRGEPVRQAPAASQDAADHAVVDAELAALAHDALLGRARITVDVLRVAGVRVHEHELADVVQEGRDEKLVALLEADLARDRARRRAAWRRRAGGSAPA